MNSLPRSLKSSNTSRAVVKQNLFYPGKRRRALLESNSPRNTRLETHRDDAVGDQEFGPPLVPEANIGR